MTKDSIRYGSLESAVVTADNSADATREFNIHARLSIEGGRLAAIYSGQVTSLPPDPSQLEVQGAYGIVTYCDFVLNNDGSYTVTMHPGAELDSEVSAAVRGFIAAARQKVEAEAPL